ncbi:NYN domain-containing protein [Patescibacteria group bacterium AH-259-L07]|nr:NYN domain-containing protein [Patescibacteria group bacterium AH-259-L07]
MRYENQRVGIFVDVANMYHSAKNLYHANVNFSYVLEQALGDRQLIRAIAYVIRSNTREEQTFFEAISKQGFEVKMKDLQIFPGGEKKADWDVGIAMDAIKLADKLDVIVLVTGDGDYVPLVTYLRENKGCRIEIMAFGETASAKLKESADGFVDMSKDKKKFLIKKLKKLK